MKSISIRWNLVNYYILKKGGLSVFLIRHQIPDESLVGPSSRLSPLAMFRDRIVFFVRWGFAISAFLAAFAFLASLPILDAFGFLAPFAFLDAFSYRLCLSVSPIHTFRCPQSAFPKYFDTMTRSYKTAASPAPLESASLASASSRWLLPLKAQAH